MATTTTATAKTNGTGKPARTIKTVPLLADAVDIKEVAAETLLIPITGTQPLIVHRFAEKARRQMLDNMQGVKSPKEPKDPKAEYESCFYYLNKKGKNGSVRYGFPSVAFKAATVGGARFYRQITMTTLKQCLFVDGELGQDGQVHVEIFGEPHMREDTVRVGGRGGGADLRYRPAFDEWTATLTITYVTSMLTLGSVLSLVNAGGMGVGTGEWRPENGGPFGTYRISDIDAVQVIQR